MMGEHVHGNVTQLLARWSDGDRAALDRLIPAVYDELRRMAGRYLRQERPPDILQPTALVHEAFVKLIDQHAVRWQNRAHFFGVAAQLMRRILVDHARQRNAQKRGGQIPHVPVDESLAIAAAEHVDVLAIDDALTRLAAIDADHVRLVELRFFGGLTIEETAEVMGWSTGSVKREWVLAKAWLRRELGGERA